MQLDDRDRAILRVLQNEGRLTNVELSARVHLSESACLRRVRALEASGVICGYGARLHPEQLGLPTNVFVHVALKRQDQADLERFEEAVQAIPEVMECYLMTGEFDYLLRVVAGDSADFEQVHSQLTRLPGVARIQSSFALRAVRQAGVLPIRPRPTDR
ncbi:MAG: Lrp/AsnC family transcriptional regulator [Myxococcales bacterium]|nr:Lrp/AsnC family transcriptional regulator [Myxococcales bacterium]